MIEMNDQQNVKGKNYSFKHKKDLYEEEPEREILTAKDIIPDYDIPDRRQPCIHCGKVSTTFTVNAIGKVAAIWSVTLCFFTGILCCVPCCINECMDKNILCANCGKKRGNIPASCC